MVRLVSVLVLSAAILGTLACGSAVGQPSPVGTTPAEPAWTTWGYVVDGQDWANWLAVCIPWDTPAAMSGVYTLKEDFLFQVDPSTSGLSDPTSVYGANWWNHDGVYGLGEFFDAGLGANDRQYALTLDLTAGTWSVFYDANRNEVNDGGSEHAILTGEVSSYFNNGGHFYGVLASDGIYHGYFSTSHNEGTPALVNGTFHAGCGEPVPEPVSWIVWSLLTATALGAGWRCKRR